MPERKNYRALAVFPQQPTSGNESGIFPSIRKRLSANAPEAFFSDFSNRIDAVRAVEEAGFLSYPFIIAQNFQDYVKLRRGGNSVTREPFQDR
jgi:hypothetical protein